MRVGGVEGGVETAVDVVVVVGRGGRSCEGGSVGGSFRGDLGGWTRIVLDVVVVVVAGLVFLADWRVG